MSCQDPQGYDCAKALERMAFFIDRELDPTRQLTP